MTMMKTIAVLLVALWTFSSPALAGLRAGCTSEAAEFCTDVTDGDPNAVCGAGGDCVCAAAYKTNAGADGCDPKGLGDSCAQTTDCADEANTECDNNECTCVDLYKPNDADDACETVLTSDCTQDTDCSGVDNAFCDTNDGSTCKCDVGYTAKDNDCMQIYDMTCANTAECTSSDDYECTGGKCKCAAKYDLLNSICQLKVTETSCSVDGDCPTNAECSSSSSKCECKSGFMEDANTCTEENGAASIAAHFGLLCAALVLLRSISEL